MLKVLSASFKLLTGPAIPGSEVSNSPDVIELVTFGRVGTEAVCLFLETGLPNRCGTEALCDTRSKTDFVWSLVGQTFTELDLFEVTDITEAPDVTKPVMLGWVGTELVCLFWEIFLPKRGGPEVLCVTELVTRRKAEFVWSLVGQVFTAFDVVDLDTILDHLGTGPLFSLKGQLVWSTFWSPGESNYIGLDVVPFRRSVTKGLWVARLALLGKSSTEVVRRIISQSLACCVCAFPEFPTWSIV